MKCKILLIFIFIITTNTFATNAVTPLGSTLFLHLFIVNLIFGILEGFVIHRFFNVKKIKAVIYLIIGNYCASFLGAFVTLSISNVIFNIFNPINLFEIAIPVTIALTFLYAIISILMIWPLIAFSQSKKMRMWKESLMASVAMQIIASILIVLLYLPATSYSFSSKLTMNQELHKTISSDFSYIYRPSHSNRFVQMNLRTNSVIEEFTKDTNTIENNMYRMYYFAKNNDTISFMMQRDNKPILLKYNVLGFHDFKSYIPFTDYWAIVNSQMKNVKDTIYINSDFRVKTAAWSINPDHWYWPCGIIIRDSDNHVLASYTIESPFLNISATNGHILNDDFILFEAKNLIILLDWKKKEYSVLGKGRYPFIFFKNAGALY